MSIEAMKLALEALHRNDYLGWQANQPVIQALRQAIEQAQKQCQCPACKIKPHASDCSVHNEPAWPNGPCDCGAVEQAQNKSDFEQAWLEWQEKTEWVQETAQPHELGMHRADVLKLRIEQAQKQEPVAWYYAGSYDEWPSVALNADLDEAQKANCTPLYTSPPPRQPLTDEEIRKAKHHMVEGAYHYSFQQGVRYAEAAHGIKGEA